MRQPQRGSMRGAFTRTLNSRARQAGRWLNQARDAMAAWVGAARGDDERNRFRRAYNQYNRNPMSRAQGERLARGYVMHPNAESINASGIREQHVGSMWLYVYRAKHRETLPYWDMYPLMFMLADKVKMKNDKVSHDHFLGLNLHYIHPRQRALLMDAINDRLLHNGFDPQHPNHDPNLYNRISYSVLSAAAQHRQFRPCVKMYRKDHVRSSLIKIPGNEWHNVLFLDIARFQKARESEIWNESSRNS